jgi:hypothetical protein
VVVRVGLVEVAEEAVEALSRRHTVEPA